MTLPLAGLGALVAAPYVAAGLRRLVSTAADRRTARAERRYVRTLDTYRRTP